jgi:hypothetical protein
MPLRHACFFLPAQADFESALKGRHNEAAKGLQMPGQAVINRITHGTENKTF